MVIELYIFRHGETSYNYRKIFTGWLDANLTKEGIKEAEKIKKQLANIPIDLGISSDLKRAKQTLEIALADKKVPTITEPIIRERDYGYLAQKNKEKFKKEKPILYELYHRSCIIAPPSGENFNMVIQRVSIFIEKLKKQQYGKYKRIAISAHGNSIRAMFAILKNLERKEIEKIEIKFGKVYYLSLDTE